jgi:ATP-dependent helicase STH1/SNF2
MVEEDDEASGLTPRPKEEGDEEGASKKRARKEESDDAPAATGGAGNGGSGKAYPVADADDAQQPPLKTESKPKGKGKAKGAEGAAGTTDKPKRPPRPRKPTLTQIEKDLSAADEGEVVAQLTAVLQSVRQMKEEETGRVLSELFVDKPDKSLYPEYYRMIKQPISLNCIGEKLMQQQQLSRQPPPPPPSPGAKEVKKYLVTAFEKDIKRVWKNAKTYNQEGSMVFLDATAMEGQVEEQLKAIKASVKQMTPQTAPATAKESGEASEADNSKKRGHSTMSKDEEKERKRQKKEKKKKKKKKKDKDREKGRRPSVGGSDSD